MRETLNTYHNCEHVYSGVNPIAFNRANFQLNAYRIAAIMWVLICVEVNGMKLTNSLQACCQLPPCCSQYLPLVTTLSSDRGSPKHIGMVVSSTGSSWVYSGANMARIRFASIILNRM